MTSLQTRSGLPGGRLVVILIRAASFLLLVLVLCAGWLGLSYLKNQGSNRRSLIAPTSVSASATTTKSSPNSQPKVAATTEPARSEPSAPRWVYTSAVDKSFYHNFKHLQANRARTAMSEEAAAERGLKPCPRCFPN